MSDTFVPIPPTNGITDPQTRNVIDALKQNISEARRTMVRQDEVAEAVEQGVMQVLSGGSSRAPAAAGVAAMQTLILQSPVFNRLGERFAQIQGEVTGAGIAQEQEIRHQQDLALAAAINRIWAALGDNNAVIEDGALAAADPSAAIAQKWLQVQAATIDANGDDKVAAIRQDFETYSSETDSTLSTTYSVRAQLSSGGQTVVGGFGLIGTVGGGGGPTIDFGVRADKFFIASTAETGTVADQLALGAEIPFIVSTTTQTVGGITYPPGVYIKRAVIADALIDNAAIANGAITNAKIGNAAITTAKIGDAQITNAKIGNAEIDTLKIAGEAVIVPRSANGSGHLTLPNQFYTSVFVPSGPTATYIIAQFYGAFPPAEPPSGTYGVSFQLRRDGVTIATWIAPGRYAGGDVFNVVGTFLDGPHSGATYSIYASGVVTSGAALVPAATLIALGVKR